MFYILLNQMFFSNVKMFLNDLNKINAIDHSIKRAEFCVDIIRRRRSSNQKTSKMNTKTIIFIFMVAAFVIGNSKNLFYNIINYF